MSSSMVFAIIVGLLIIGVSSYSLDSNSNDDFELELRSILFRDALMNKRQGGYNTIDAALKCEIQCVDKLRNPTSGQGLSIKAAAKACQSICAAQQYNN